ncbi:hypothetical protein CBOM_02888 [Ceraceosorus bombacis]|uniref:Uncharacterized protein n=1 Tax=Ceraceosorus bombacis TaxID=401625 RepID=A0A0P1BGG5_9BASI|nr:hypothetical protein CBOM_02888 [Ceraceosorus bombacis]
MLATLRVTLLAVVAAGMALAMPITPTQADAVSTSSSQVSCKPLAAGQWTLRLERQQLQGLWLSPMKQNGARLAAVTRVGKDGQKLTFSSCESKYMGLQNSKSAEGDFYGQLKTERGTCLTRTKSTTENAAQWNFVAKPCPVSDDAEIENTFWRLTKSAKNGLTYDNTNYVISPASESNGKKKFGFNFRAKTGVLFAGEPKPETSDLILYRSQNL